MILHTEQKDVEIRPTTKKIVDLTKKLNEKNLSQLYFKAMSENNIEALGTIIFEFGETDGHKSFTNVEYCYNFLDTYMKESGKSYYDIFEELADFINDEGFFIKKYKKEELESLKTDALSGMDMNAIIQEIVTQVASQEISQMVN